MYKIMFTPEELTFNNDFTNAQCYLATAAIAIKENWKLIENKDFKQFCDVVNNLAGETQTAIYYYLLKSGIDPVDYLDFIPWCYCSFLNIENYTVPSHVTKIMPFAFYNCKNLENIVIPNSVTEIGVNAFNWCYNLKSVSIPIKFKDDITGGIFFYGCPKFEIIYT